MQTLILGAGALGSLFGARLAKAGTPVSLLSTNKEHIKAINSQGLRLEELDGAQTCHFLKAYAKPEDLNLAPDLVLILVKSYATAKAVASVASYCPQHSIFLTLQNGIDNWEQIAKHIPAERILAGVTAQGATLVEPGFVKHGGQGPTLIGELQGQPTTRVQEIVDLLNNAGLQAEPTEQTKQRIWEKLLVNIGINALTALTGINNGKIVKYQSAEAIAVQAVREAREVAQALKIMLPPDMSQKVLRVAEATANNTSSMLQDIKNNKPTEIRAINEAIVQLGKENGISTPVNWTLSRLVQTIEEDRGKT